MTIVDNINQLRELSARGYTMTAASAHFGLFGFTFDAGWIFPDGPKGLSHLYPNQYGGKTNGLHNLIRVALVDNHYTDKQECNKGDCKRLVDEPYKPFEGCPFKELIKPCREVFKHFAPHHLIVDFLTNTTNGRIVTAPVANAAVVTANSVAGIGTLLSTSARALSLRVFSCLMAAAGGATSVGRPLVCGSSNPVRLCRHKIGTLGDRSSVTPGGQIMAQDTARNPSTLNTFDALSALEIPVYEHQQLCKFVSDSLCDHHTSLEDNKETIIAVMDILAGSAEALRKQLDCLFDQYREGLH